MKPNNTAHDQEVGLAGVGFSSPLPTREGARHEISVVSEKTYPSGGVLVGAL